MHDVRLEVNGVAYGGFRSGEVTFSLESVCNSFSLDYVDVWAEGAAPVPIREGDRCKIFVDGSVVLDGWVDGSERGYDVDTRKLSVSGRSTAGDLIDCSIVDQETQWNGQRLSQIVADLVRPYAAVQTMVFGDEGAPLSKFTAQKDEHVADAIVRAARLRAMLVYTAGDILTCAKPAAVRTSTILRRGDPILQGAFATSMAQRFSRYVFKGQTRARDDLNGVAASRMRGAAEDHAITRHRPILVTAGGADGPDDLGARAIMMRNQAAGRGERLNLVVAGWKTDEGYFWEPNLLVRVTDDWLEIDQDLLVVTVSVEFGDRGWRTQLELCDPRAFQMDEPPSIQRPARRVRAAGETWSLGLNSSGQAIVVEGFNAVAGAGTAQNPSGFGPLSNTSVDRLRGIPAPQPSRAGRRPRRR